MRKTTVLIIDSQPIFRAGVQRALAEHDGLDELGILACDPGNDGEEASRQIAEHSPDVALVDADCSAMSGIQFAKRITREFPFTKVVMLSACPNADELFEVMKTGAVAYLSKDATVAELSETIRRAASGEYLINDDFAERPKIAWRVLEQFQDIRLPEGPEDRPVPRLTPREIQFLNLIAEDNSNKQIAGILGIDEVEIKKYVSTILRKLNAGDRAHAVMLTLCNNWLALQEDEDVSLLERRLSSALGLASTESSPSNRASRKPSMKTQKGGKQKSGPAKIRSRGVKPGA